MKFFGEPEDAQFKIKVIIKEFATIRQEPEIARITITLNPKFESIKEAEAFLYYVFGTGNYVGDISISSAIVIGANDSARKWLENVQIGWENDQFVDLEKYHDI